MELHDLKIFHYIAIEQSFSKAAQELFISQPAVSASLKKLEFDMGCKLFDRTGKNIRLTSAGHILLGYTTKIFEILHDIYADIEKQSGEIKGSITIATDEMAGSSILPRIVSNFISKHENVEIHLQVTSSLIVRRLVEEGRADFAVVGGEFEDKSSQFCIERLADERVVLIGPNVLPNLYDGNDKSGFDKREFIMHDKGTALATVGADIMNKLGIEGRSRLTMNSVNAMIQAVKANVGIAAVPLSSVCEDIKTGRVIHLYPAEIDMQFSYNIVYLKSRFQGLTEKTLVEFIKTGMSTLLNAF